MPKRQKKVSSICPADGAGVVPDSFWFFKSQKTTGDYHKAFNHQNFLQWFTEKLLPALRGQKCLIRMDNAKYHFAQPELAAITKLKKEELKETLAAAGVQFNNFDSVSTLRLKLREHTEKTMKPPVVQAAEAEGYIILPIVPYHSDLQPIEML